MIGVIGFRPEHLSVKHRFRLQSQPIFNRERGAVSSCAPSSSHKLSRTRCRSSPLGNRDTLIPDARPCISGSALEIVSINIVLPKDQWSPENDLCIFNFHFS